MLPGIELANCQNLAVPADVMRHVVRVESSFNPYAIGVVGGRLARQPRSLPEALATARMLEQRGYNFSVGLAQVNRFNLGKYGLDSYAEAFAICPNLQAGSRILADCHARANGDWGRALSCYYAGDFTTGYRHGYVEKVLASMRSGDGGEGAIPVIPSHGRHRSPSSRKGSSTSSPAARPDAPAELFAYRTASAPPAAATLGSGDSAFVF